VGEHPQGVTLVRSWARLAREAPALRDEQSDISQERL
jgi:hypothetical protein